MTWLAASPDPSEVGLGVPVENVSCLAEEQLQSVADADLRARLCRLLQGFCFEDLKAGIGRLRGGEDHEVRDAAARGGR